MELRRTHAVACHVQHIVDAAGDPVVAILVTARSAVGVFLRCSLKQKPADRLPGSAAGILLAASFVSPEFLLSGSLPGGFAVTTYLEALSR